MAQDSFNEVFGLLVRVLPVMHKKIHRDVFKATIEQAGEGMAPHHLMILKMIRDGGIANPTEIGEEIGISQSQMTHSVDKLAGLDMLERQTDEQDRRKVHLRLTARGTAYLEKLDPIMRSRMEAKLAELTDDDMKKLAASLQEVADIFSSLHWE